MSKESTDRPFFDWEEEFKDPQPVSAASVLIPEEVSGLLGIPVAQAEDWLTRRIEENA